MNVVICSIFRDAEWHLERYFQQTQALARLLEARGDSFRYNLAEGDSNDLTFDNLHSRLDFSKDRLIKRDHGGPRYESVDNICRFLQFSYVYTGVWQNLLASDDVVIYCEGDLVWEPEVMMGLINWPGRSWTRGTQDVEQNIFPRPVDAIAPMTWFESKEKRFYDTWAYRRNGVHFSPSLKPHPDIRPGELLELDSAGSVIVMTGEAARAAKFEPAELCVVGMTMSLRKAGYRLWLDPEADVVHL